MTNDARELLRSGDLVAATEAVKQDVRSAPRDARHRVFLFQLFCVVGDWERALAQLAVAAQLDAAATSMADAYRALIRCEVLRARVFAGARAPTIFGDPAPWMSLLVEALRALADGRAEAAAALRDEAFEAAEPAAGRIDGEHFAWIADADPRIGPMLEAVIEGRYFWIPFARVSHVAFEPPVDLRDQVWQPARFTWSNGGEAVGFVPTRYPGAETDPALRLARRTEWHDEGLSWTLGHGQRMFATDAGEHPLLDTRVIAIDAA